MNVPVNYFSQPLFGYFASLQSLNFRKLIGRVGLRVYLFSGVKYLQREIMKNGCSFAGIL